MIAHHASVYLVQLPGTDCGQVGPLPAHPSASPKPGFPAKLFFFPFQWLNRDQEAVRYTEAQLAKERRECPGELSMSITSDYLQLYPEDFEGKASNGTAPAMFIQGETSLSVFNFENVPRGLSPYQKWPEYNFLTVKYIPECLHYCMYAGFMVTYTIIISYP